MSFSHLVGHEILVNVPKIDANLVHRVKLIEVEVGGIWVESEQLTQDMLKALNMPASKLPLLFFPYSQIGYVLVGSEDLTALSDEAFGV